MTARASGVATQDAIRRNPVAFCREVLRFDPWSRQRLILESVRDHRRTAVRSCHGSGKTAIAGRATLWFLAAFPGSKVLTTAPVWAQIKFQLWREIAAGYIAAEGFFADAELYDTRLELEPDWFALGLSTDQPERFAGHHAERLLLIVDEASGVDEGIFEAGESFLTTAGARLLLIGNPTTLAGTFHRAFHSERALWNTISISAYDTPAFTGEQVPDDVLRKLVSREWVETARRKWGEASPLFQVRVLGEFPSTADDTVCPLSEVEAAAARQAEPGHPVIVSCDVARFGSDETVIAVREGSRVRIAQAYHGRDLMETAGRILSVARKVAARRQNDPPVLVVDDAGVGGGVTDRLREVSEFKVTPFNSANAAGDSREYPNRRSEAWFQFAERLPGIDLDPDEQLAADLVAPTYKIDSQGRRVAEAKSDTKKRLGRSPDRADAVLMAFASNDSKKLYQVRYAPDWSAGSDDHVVKRNGLTFRGKNAWRHIDREDR